MAQDIKIQFDFSTLEADLILGDGDLKRENGLETAVLISLFTDQRASDNDNIDDPNDKRGWWGDLIPNRGDKIGSKLWQFDRAKSDNATMLKIKQAIENCLQWMIDDGVAQKIEVFLEKTGDPGNYRLKVTIKIYKSFGGVEAVMFDDLWNAQIGA